MNKTPLLSETFRDAFTQMLQGKQISSCVVAMDALSYTMKKYGNNDETKLLKIVNDLSYGMSVGDRLDRGFFPHITPKIISSLLIGALGHALDAHNYQARRISSNTTTVPYFCHLLDVVGILLDAEITDETILIAAAMHDAIEDTQYNANTIEYLFGLPVRCLVVQLTESEYNPDLPKAPKKQRCEAYINSLINSPEDIARCLQLTRCKRSAKNGGEELFSTQHHSNILADKDSLDLANAQSNHPCLVSKSIF